MPEALSLRESPFERRYLAMVRIGGEVATCLGWGQLASAISWSLGSEASPPAVRLWGHTPKGLADLATYPEAEQGFPGATSDELREVGERREPAFTALGSIVAPLVADNLHLGALEVGSGFDDLELMAHLAPIVACRFALLADAEPDRTAIIPRDLEPAESTMAVMGEFAAEAKRLLDHDRLSAYLLTPNRHAFERFAVAGSPLLDGEGILIPYGEVGLRHVIETNEALVSDDLAEDPRIMGREDRVIARAGFHGLVSVPLRHDGRPFGVLNFVSRHPGYYTASDIPIAEQIAGQVSAFVENLRAQRRQRMFVRQRAADAERARLSRDLYQTVAESASTIVGLAEDLSATAADATTQAGAVKIADVARQEMVEFRRAVADLAPRALELADLTELIARSAEKLRKSCGTVAHLEIAEEADALPLQIKRTVYRIVQEALNNIGAHARASRVDLGLRVGGGLSLEISDDGVGFDEVTPHGGLGISHMRDRSEAIGGHLTIESSPMRGTKVSFILDSIRSTFRLDHDPVERVEGPVAPCTRVLVAAPTELARAGLAGLLDSRDQIRVVGEVANTKAGGSVLRQLQPDVLLMAEQTDPATLPATIAEIERLSPGTRLVVLGDFGHSAETNMLALGAGGILPRDCTPQQLADAIDTIAAGGVLIRAPHEGHHDGEDDNTLSHREREILTLIAIGATNAEIGRELYLATKTVERQVATITRKLDARNRAHAAAIGVARKLVLRETGDAEA